MNFFVTVVRREFVRLRDGATKCLNCGGGKTALAAALVFLSGISSAFAVIPVENVDVTELVRYDGDVFIHSVGNRGDQRGQTVGMMERNTVDVASVLREIDLDNGLYKFTIPQGCSISTISTGYNHLSEIVMTDRTNAGVRKDVADSFLSRIDFEFKGEWND